jgi:hypothetical protein
MITSKCSNILIILCRNKKQKKKLKTYVSFYAFIFLAFFSRADGEAVILPGARAA